MSKKTINDAIEYVMQQLESAGSMNIEMAKMMLASIQASLLNGAKGDDPIDFN